jgi:hypothetical protein
VTGYKEGLTRYHFAYIKDLLIGNNFFSSKRMGQITG